MYTKKTNNTNKLMQVSYHSTLTKIQKLQNLKKKISIPAGIARNWPVFKPVWNVDVSILVYIPVGTASISTVLTTLHPNSIHLSEVLGLSCIFVLEPYPLSLMSMFVFKI